ncbi:GTPase IMAP family member 4 isoform X2 [Oryzias latipes]|uniref:GTPase IMAP family member 4 isoform X2 n=1 Tax=Oryzias latipes TaxID=8090 RepID=UPI0005CC49FC|nr:GTPase IMAP family member 4 isoform X2 [Oryzias latipes]
MSASELRLVLLGPADAGRKAAVCSLLGLQDNPQGSTDVQECSKFSGEVCGTQVTVVSSPAWFNSAWSSADRRKVISSFIALSSPAPHAFLLCVPVNQPADGEAKALDALETLFGPSAVAENTIVLFTHMEELWEDEQLEDYIVTWRKDLRELVERCGGSYHTLETRNGGEEDRKAVEGLLAKVEQAALKTGAVSCPLYEEVEERLRERQQEILRQRTAEMTDEELEAARLEAERSIGGLDVNLDHIFSSTTAPPDPPAPSLLWGWWEKLVGWIRWLPSLVRREALFGSLIGLFVGGTLGGAVGATAGSVVTEVGRRKEKKNE